MVVLDEDTVLYLSSANEVVEDSSNNNFQVNLSCPINLPENQRFEVALTKLIYPKTFFNVTSGSVHYYSPTLKKVRYNSVPSAYYDSPESFVNAFNKMLGVDKSYFVLSFSPEAQVYMLNAIDDKSGKPPFMEISNNLKMLTGLPTVIDRGGFHVGMPGSWDLSAGNSIMCVNCNLVSPIHLNSQVRPMLTSISFGAGQETKSQIQYEPEHLLYLPINSDRDIRSVSISIVNLEGKGFPFVGGDVLCVLHLRPSIARI